MPIICRCCRMFILFPCYYELYECVDLSTPSGFLGKWLLISYMLMKNLNIFQCSKCFSALFLLFADGLPPKFCFWCPVFYLCSNFY